MKKLEEHDQRSLTLESDVAFLKVDAHKKGILFEEHTSKLNQILEIVLHTNEMLCPRPEIERQRLCKQRLVKGSSFILSTIMSMKNKQLLPKMPVSSRTKIAMMPIPINRAVYA